MSFIDYYPIVTLPRVSGLDLGSRVVIPEVDSADSNSINIGISKSNISNYIIYPSPRLVWSYPISPSSVIECMDAKDTTYMIGITERKTHKLLSLNRETDETKELKFKHSLQNVKINEFVWVVLSNGDIHKIDINSLEIIETIPESESGTCIYSYIDGSILTVTKVADQIKYKVVAGSVSESHVAYEDCLYEVHADSLYKVNKTTKVAEKMNFRFQVKESTHLSFLGDGPISFAVTSEDRIVVGDNVHMHLVNIKFQTKLADFSFDENSENQVLQAVKVKGSSLNTNETRLFYLKLNLKKNKLNLNVITVNIGFNNLLSNLGKGFHNDDKGISVLPNLLEEEYESKPDTTVASLIKSYSKNLLKFETEAISYLKGRQCKPLHHYSFDSEDRPVDPKVISTLTGLIFKQEDGLKINGKTPKFILNYLLSHKLFPESYTMGLLPLLASLQNDRMLRQCITSTPNLPLTDIIDTLILNSNQSITTDVLKRLEEFKVEDIIEVLKQRISEGQDLKPLIKRLIELNSIHGFKLLKTIIDLGGLVNNLEDELVQKLVKYINYKVKLIEVNSLNLNLIYNQIQFSDNKLPNYSFETLQS